MGQSQILGDVLAGIILGPAVLNLVRPVPEIDFIVDMGLFFFFFIVGSREIERHTLRRVLRGRLFLVSIIAFAIPVLSVHIFLVTYGIDPSLSILMSGVIGLSSLGVLVRTLLDLNIMKSHIAIQTFGFVALIEFIGLVFVTFAHECHQLEALVNVELVIYLITRIALFLLVVGIVSFVIAPRLLGTIQRRLRTREASFGIISSLILFIVWFSETLGVHGSLGALVFGLGLSDFINSPEHVEIIQGFRSLSYGLFVPVFFAGTGLYLNFLFLDMSHVFLISFIIIIIAGKLVGGVLGAKMLGCENVLFLGVGTLSKGGVELGLALTMLMSGTVDSKMFSLMLFVIFVMLVVFPIFIKIPAGRIIIDEKASTMEEEILPLYCRYTCLDLRVKDVMSPSNARIKWDITLNEFIKRHLDLNYRDYFVVDDGDDLVGLLGPTDLKKVPEEQYGSTLVKDIMRTRIPMIFPDTSIHLAIEVLLSEGVYRLPVVLPEDPRIVVGTFDRGDAIKIIFKSTENRNSFQVE